MQESYVATCFDLDRMSWRFEKMPRKGRWMTQALGAPDSSKPFSVGALGAFSFETVRLVCVMPAMLEKNTHKGNPVHRAIALNLGGAP